MIVSSTYNVGHEQHDGRHYVSEVHTDQDGNTYPIEYLANVGTDYNALLSIHAAALAESLAVQEFNQTIL